MNENRRKTSRSAPLSASQLKGGEEIQETQISPPKRTISLILFSLLSLSLTPYQWPIKEPQLTRTFGERERTGIPFVGIEVLSTEELIQPYEKGKIILQNPTKTLFGKNYKVSLPVVIIEHKEEGIRSIYEGVTSLNRERREILAEVPFAKKERESRLRLYLYDIEKRRYLNPMITLEYLADRRAPVLSQLRLRPLKLAADTQDILITNQQTIIPSGEYTLFLEGYDVISSQDVLRRAAPQRITLSHNNRTGVVVDYDTLYTSGGEYRILGESAVNYGELLPQINRYNLGNYTFTSKREIFRFRITDYNNYVNTKNFSFRVVPR